MNKQQTVTGHCVFVWAVLAALLGVCAARHCADGGCVRSGGHCKLVLEWRGIYSHCSCEAANRLANSVDEFLVDDDGQVVEVCDTDYRR